MICKNCEQEFEGNFCNHCGQKASVQQINFQYLIQELSSTLFKMNKGFFYTIKELFIRPGHSIREFLEGKRRWHVKPFAFVLLVSTIYVLFTHFVGRNTLLGEVISGLTNGLSHEGRDHSSTVDLLNWLGNNHAYFTLILLPMFSLASYLAFIKSGYNYFEHVILNLYIGGQQIFIQLIFSTSFLFVEDDYYIEIAPFALGILFIFWAFAQFFESKSLFVKISLTGVTFILYLLQIMVLLYVAGYLEALFTGS